MPFAIRSAAPAAGSLWIIVTKPERSEPSFAATATGQLGTYRTSLNCVKGRLSISVGTVNVKKLLILLRVHRRHAYLPAIWKQISYLTKDRSCQLIIQADRPSIEVVAEVDAYKRRAPKRIRVDVIEAPAPVVSSAGQKWYQSVQNMWLLRHGDEDAGIVWDDDWLFSPSALKEMRGHLEFFEHDCLDAVWHHMWDNEHANARFPSPHYAAALFRIYRGDNFDPDLTSHCPQHPARSKNRLVLQHPVYHFGYATEEDRLRCWEAFRRAGRIDAHTIALTKPPILKKVR